MFSSSAEEMPALSEKMGMSGDYWNYRF